MYLTLYIHVIGQLMSAELVLQCWQDPPVTTPRAAGAVLLSGVVFVAASKTTDPRYIWYFTPPYVLCVLALLKSFRPRRVQSPAGGWRGAGALLLALAIGFVSANVIWQNHSQISDWFLRLMLRQRPRESSGMARTPRLGKVFELALSPQRVIKIDNAPSGILY